jgi:putative ABC transport system permease protein
MFNRVAAIPGVEHAALADRVPFLDGGSPTRLSRRGAAGDAAGQQLEADVHVVGGDFFQVLSIPLLRGRLFSTSDDAARLPVIVISDRIAKAHWHGADPLGDRLLVQGTWRTIVGVVGTTVEPSPLRPSVPAAFVPYLQSGVVSLQVLVRSGHAGPALAAAVRRQVRAVDPDQPVVDLRTMEAALDAQMTPFRLILVLMAVFGAIALSLSAVGLYAVMAHDVSRRTHEMGIRMAVGARSGEVVQMVVREGLRLAAAGLIVGLLFGAAVGKILPSELFGARGLSLAHYAGAAALWLAVALLACLVPARRAASVDPLSALRCE